MLVVLAEKNFRDAEFLVPRDFWTRENIAVVTASSGKISVGRFGFCVENDFLIDEVSADDFDGIFFVGGGGALDFLEKAAAKKLAENFEKSGKLCAAICIAPRLFLKWGLLKNRKMTGWNGDGNLPKLAAEADAIFTGAAVESDKNAVTADGPSSAELLANAVMEKLLV